MAARKSATRLQLLAALVAAGVFSAATTTLAEEIYHWVDEDGGVHYSDKRPVQDAPVAVIEIEAPPATRYDAEDDPYSILNQAARTHERWLDLEEARQARAEEREETVVYRNPPSDYDDGYDSYLGYSSYYPYYAYRPSNGVDYRPGQGRQQIYAMNTLNLLGPRPSSINSGMHQERVFRSQFLPLVPPPPAVNPLPR